MMRVHLTRTAAGTRRARGVFVTEAETIGAIDSTRPHQETAREERNT